MARARNIKPAFFTNDELADNEPLGRILFIGMWTIADFKGDIVWRPKRVKAQILPYDNCDIVKLAINLDKSGFIRFYSDGDEIYCRVVSFATHQNPHKNERDKGSDIPSYSDDMRQRVDLKDITINLDKSGSKRNDSTSDPADSLIPYPDSLNLNPSSDQCDIDRMFEEFYKKYPKKVDKQNAQKKFDSIFKKMKAEPAEQLLNLIMINIDQRTQSGQWDLSNKQFIQGPAKYLLNRLWEDEVVAVSNGRTQQLPPAQNFESGAF